MKKKLKKLLGDVRGSVDPIEGIVLFMAIATVVYITFPILDGVQSATNDIIPVPTNTSTAGESAIYNASTTAQTTISSSVGLISLEALLVAVVVLISTVLLIRKNAK